MSQIARTVEKYIAAKHRLVLHKQIHIAEDGVPTGTTFMVIPESPIVSDAAKVNRLFKELSFPEGSAELHTCTMDHDSLYWPHVVWRTTVGEHNISTTTTYRDNSVLPKSFAGKTRRVTHRVKPIIYTVTLFMYTSERVALHVEMNPPIASTHRAILQKHFGDRSL